MTDKELKIWVKPNPEAYARYKKDMRKKRAKLVFRYAKTAAKILSQIILWICAVGGFVLALIQYLQNPQ